MSKVSLFPSIEVLIWYNTNLKVWLERPSHLRIEIFIASLLQLHYRKIITVHCLFQLTRMRCSFIYSKLRNSTSCALCIASRRERTGRGSIYSPFDGPSFNVVSVFTFLRTDKRVSRSNLPFHPRYIYSWSLRGSTTISFVLPCTKNE